MKTKSALVFSLPAYLSALLLLILSACEPVAQIRVMKPAAVFPPDHVQTITVINRSHYGSDVVNAVTGMLLNALFNSDNVAWQNSTKRQVVRAFSKHLPKISRFKVKLSKTEMEGTGDAFFPAPLPWQTVDEICHADSSDALVALEYYDADASSDESQRDVTTKDKDDKEVTTTEYTVRGTTTIKLGWRMYDSKTHTILDEFADTRTESWAKTSNEKSEIKSFKMNINAGAISHVAGVAYGDCFISCWVTYSRRYYGKGSDLMKKAAKKSKSEDWDGAVDLWKEIIGKGDTVLAGKAAYNLAVACEVKDELDWAKQWAEQSFYKFGNKAAGEYIYAIDGRIEDRKRLNEQMKGTGN